MFVVSHDALYQEHKYTVAQHTVSTNRTDTRMECEDPCKI